MSDGITERTITYLQFDRRGFLDMTTQFPAGYPQHLIDGYRRKVAERGGVTIEVHDPKAS
ncbi:hypothetical protein [Streptomyces californicus]|uniref:hypothetical protein n=1 Tax=Streptomyces californicus TaxID=67351 RepID=UPI00296E6F02|nr:hypothetical protein [Streptomyces californicus]MDW4912598.1 hypothetical protein [Streptomyces californicus]